MIEIPFLGSFIFLGIFSSALWGLHYSVAGKLSLVRSPITIVFWPCMVSFFLQILMRGGEIYSQSLLVFSASFTAADATASASASVTTPAPSPSPRRLVGLHGELTHPSALTEPPSSRLPPPSLFLFFVLCSTYFAANYLGMLAISSKNATMAGILEVCYPLFIALVSYIFYGELSLSYEAIFGAVLIFAGVIVVTLGELRADLEEEDEHEKLLLEKEAASKQAKPANDENVSFMDELFPTRRRNIEKSASKLV